MRTHLLLLLPLALTTACLEDDFAPEADPDAQALYGNISYDNATCSTAQVDFLEKTMRYGRIAASTPAFAQCVQDAVNNGEYRQCIGDPFYGQSTQVQMDAAIDASLTGTDVFFACSGGGGNASTSLGTYATMDESLSWGGWLQQVVNELSMPPCTAGLTPGVNCRSGSDPWPWSQAAGIVWHEVMHRHGYTHGANDQAGAIAACGYAGDPNWHFQWNTMPYIVGNCVDQVLAESGRTCGALEVCEADELMVIDDLGGTCSCHHDPRMSGLGLAAVELDELHMEEMVARGDWMGAWNLGSADQILGHGDVDDDGLDEVVIRSNWGIATLGQDASGRLKLESSATTGTMVGSWQVATSDRLAGMGDFDGDGRAEMAIWGATGLSIVEIQPNGSWQNRKYTRWGSALGTHVLSSTDTLKVGDVDHNGRDDLLLHSTAGQFTIVKNTNAGFVKLTSWAPAVWVGTWNHGAADRLELVADVTGDLKDDFLLRSSWGVGLFRWNGTALVQIQSVANGTALPAMSVDPAWSLSASDTFVATPDLNGDGRDDLLVRGTTALGVLSVSNNVLKTRVRQAYGNLLDGGWRLGASDSVVAVANADGLRGDEVIVSSPWGMGVLSFGRTYNYSFIAHTLSPYNSVWSGWLLRPGDRAIEAGDVDGDGAEELLFWR